ncbi:MAG: efflux RND transporter periplasmic adaptor subunit [Verrucomicrobia bacterium]|nr:efflux RND transporter periplasmic adaptor subunit [Verrucomicrobiota bacterium]
MANPKSKKRKKIIVVSLILLLAAGGGVFAYFKKKEVVITVQKEQVARRNITELVVANGRIQPVLQVKISPEVSGEIIALPVKEGQQVKKGDLLLKIKPDLYIASKNSSEASYLGSLAGKTTAEASLQKAELEFKRNLELFAKKLISDSAYLEVKTAYDIAKAQLESSVHQVAVAKAALQRAEEDLSKTTIVSPLTGTVSRLNSQLGERVVGTAMMAGTEVMTVADLNEMEARVDIGEIDVVLIALGQKARLEVDAYRDRKFNGIVTEIANSSKGAGMLGASGGNSGGGQSQEATKFEVKIRIKEKETFRPGMSVNAEIETRSRTNVLSVPIASVTTRLPKAPDADKRAGAKSDPKQSTTNSAKTDPVSSASTNAPSMTSTNNSKPDKKPGEAPKPIEVVFVVEAERAKMLPVKRGISDDSYVEITEGLKEGQEVVSGGYKAISRELENGKRIKIGKPPAEVKK